MVRALLAGLRYHRKACFLIHLTGCITVSETTSSAATGDNDYAGANGLRALGELDPHVWSDIDDLAAIRSLPRDRVHRAVDALVFNAAATHGAHVHTAIVCAPDIYGSLAGADAPPGAPAEYRMLRLYCDEMARHRAPIYVGEGKNRRSMVHIADLARLYVALVDETARSLRSGVVNPDCWDKKVRARPPPPRRCSRAQG